MNAHETLFGVGSRVRASRFGEWMNGTVLAVPMPDVALIEFDNGAKVHVLVSRLREPVDE